jgi:hypothetical protein
VNSAFSQDKKFNYQANTSPSVNNKLSIYLQNNFSKKELKKVSYNHAQNNIILSFYLNEKLEVFDIDVSTKNLEIDKKLEDIFTKFPIQELNINTPSPSKKYSLQIISKDGRKSIFNCSTKIIEERGPNCKSCDTIKQFNDRKLCFAQTIQNHFYKTLNFALIKGEAKEKDSLIFISYFINTKGKLIYKKNKKDTQKTISEIKRSLNLFPEIINPAQFNNSPKKSKKSVYIYFDQKEKNISKNRFLSYSKPNSENKLSKYFYENLDSELLVNAELNEYNSDLKVHFEISPKRKLINLRTNSRSKFLENSILELLNKYPIRELNIADPHRLNSYSLIVLQHIEGKTLINCSTHISFMRTPVFRGCEHVKNNRESKKCFSEKIQKHVNHNFNVNISKDLNLKPGIVRIFGMFKIDKLNLKVKDIKVKSPHPELDKETERVLNSIPRLVSPLFSNSQPYDVRYSLPIVFAID